MRFLQLVCIFHHQILIIIAPVFSLFLLSVRLLRLSPFFFYFLFCKIIFLNDSKNNKNFEKKFLIYFDSSFYAAQLDHIAFDFVLAYDDCVGDRVLFAILQLVQYLGVVFVGMLGLDLEKKKCWFNVHYLNQNVIQRNMTILIRNILEYFLSTYFDCHSPLINFFLPK